MNHETINSAEKRNYNMVCLVNEHEFDELIENNPDALDVRYLELPDRALEAGITIPPDRDTSDYLLSPISVQSKYSEAYTSCVAIIVTARDKVTGQIVNFLSHQVVGMVNPNESNCQNWVHDIDQSMGQIAEYYTDVDAVVMAGSTSFWGMETADYTRMIQFVRALMHNHNIPVHIAVGPKDESSYGDAVFIQGGTRNIFLFRVTYLESEISQKSLQTYTLDEYLDSVAGES